jgi:membrane protein YqaA with SNARE-associated domain
VNKFTIPKWLGGLLATYGGVALFTVAFLDSSFLSFPLVTDFMVMSQAALHPERVLYYAAMATLGSLAGCLALYLVALQGGEWFYRKRAGQSPGRIREWVSRNGFASILVASLLPPPLPFKVFIVAAGAFRVRWRTFVLALLVGRGARYLLEGFLAIRYGAAAGEFLLTHKLVFALILCCAIALSILLSRIATRDSRSV